MWKVLIVDDEVPIRQWMKFCIDKLEDYEVIGMGANGAEGYSIFRKEQPDIIITDVRMPGIDGLAMLEMIRSAGNNPYTVILTSHEDFEYARKALKLGATEYVLKTEITEESLKQILDKGKVSYQKEGGFKNISDRNRYLSALIFKEDQEKINSLMIKKYNIELEGKAYMAFNIYHKNPLEELEPADLGENWIIFSIDIYNTMFVGNLVKKAAGSERERIELLQKYCNLIQKSEKIHIGCSDVYLDLEQIGFAMQQAYQRSALKFYQPKATIFFGAKTVRPEGGEKYKIRFSKALVNQDFHHAMEIKDQMIEEIRKEEPVDIAYVKGLFIFFMMSLLHFTQEEEELVEELLPQYRRRLEESSTLAETEKELEEIFNRYCFTKRQETDLSYSIRGAIAYMEKNFAKPITLSDVATHVGLSAEYLSRIFKEETGIKFVVYLNNLRLKHAVYLLENSNLKIYEVAEQVGYSNLSYFSAVFKKNFGKIRLILKTKIDNFWHIFQI